MLYKTEAELLEKAAEAEGMTFGQIDKNGRLLNEKSKGSLGQVIEESYFGYQINSNREADFSEISVELKVTPVKRNKNGCLSSKERLVLNIINYHEEVLKEFETSSFWKKNKKILMMFYSWWPEMRRADYKVLKSYLHTYPEEDLQIIRKDWELIVGKIRAGLAHELSEADTNYLGACTKGATKSSLRTQPFSPIPAMQRAFSLKQSYMTALVRKVIDSESMVSISTPEEMFEKTLEEMLHERFAPYVGMSLEEISTMDKIEVNHNAKSFLQIFISSLLGIKGTKLNQIEEFAKANIQLKTVRLEPNGIPKEHMSFKNVNFKEWSNETWENSWVRSNFEETKYLFVVFNYKETEKQNPERKLYFKGVRLWNMPQRDIDGPIRDFWKHLQVLINEGITLQPVEQKNRTIVRNNLPKPGYNGVCHIRPKGRDGSDKVPLPDGRRITKQAFWLDNDYIGMICNKE